MVKIGVIGEHPQNDSQALINLLGQSGKIEKKKFRFKVILDRLRGSQLDENPSTPNKKAVRLLRQAFLINKFNFIIYIRDLDKLPSNTKEIKEKKQWFDKFEKQAGNGEGKFFLAIYELESLILADVDTFNKIYKTKIKFSKNPMFQDDPKGLLMKATSKNQKKYKESDCSDLFKKLDITTILKNHKGVNSFKEFYDNLVK